MSRMMRRVIIAVVFFFYNALLIWGVYALFFRTSPTCFDNKQNQNEQGIDCGGICTNACIEVITGQDFQVKEVSFVAGGENRYDVLATLTNVNESIGSPEFRYTFELKDGSGAVLVSRSGKSTFLPRETKNLIALNLETSGLPVLATLRIEDVAWEKASGYQGEPRISIYQKRYGQVTSGFGFSEAYGLVSNESPYDFRLITIQVILRDKSGKLLALNTHEMRTVTAQESRDFSLIWPTPFPGTVEQVDMEVDADVYHSENFVKQYFPGRRY